jgi:hypothetical protein
VWRGVRDGDREHGDGVPRGVGCGVTGVGVGVGVGVGSATAATGCGLSSGKWHCGAVKAAPQAAGKLLTALLDVLRSRRPSGP